MLISESKIKLAAAVCTKRFMTFCYYYGCFKRAEERKIAFESRRYESGKLSYSFAEMKDPEKELNDAYIRSAQAAISKLFALDAEFYKVQRMHICCYLENIEHYLQALEEISEFESFSPVTA